jgi:CRISPR system Cascade subunit CasC
MIIELHILQNFAPANLNRDDTGSPKDCEFGGYRRARISSQCIKRSIRQTFSGQGLIESDKLASRTKRLIDELHRRLIDQGKDSELARRVVENILNGIELKRNDDGKTQYLLFLGQNEIERLAQLCLTYWDKLVQISPSVSNGDEEGAKKTKSKDQKKEIAKLIPDEIKKATLRSLDGGQAVDLALFGRMLADLPEKNIDAASQVAHAISTNRASMEFDFYTAVDDLRPDDTQGSDMLGTVEFNSSCFYRYANVDVKQLLTNLGNDRELTARAVHGFLSSTVTAVPTGKQNSMAAQNPPSFVMAVVRERGCWSLTNAFLKPIRPTMDGDLVQNSIIALDSYWQGLTGMYGADQIKGCWLASLSDDGLTNLKSARCANFKEVVDNALNVLGSSSLEIKL